MGTTTGSGSGAFLTSVSGSFIRVSHCQICSSFLLVLHLFKGGVLKCSKNRHLVCDLIIALILRAEPSEISQICSKQLVRSPLKSAVNKFWQGLLSLLNICWVRQHSIRTHWAQVLRVEKSSTLVNRQTCVKNTVLIECVCQLLINV